MLEFLTGTAAEGGNPAVPGAIDILTSAIGSIWTMATANPLIAFSIGVTIVGVAIGVFTSLRRAL